MIFFRLQLGLAQLQIHRYVTLLDTGVIYIDYIKSKDKITDPLTQGLNKELIENYQWEWD